MSNSLVLCNGLIGINSGALCKSFSSCDSLNFVASFRRRKRRVGEFALSASKRNHSKKRSWWQRFFFDDDGNWLGLRDDDMLENELNELDELPEDSSDGEISVNEKFEAWKRRAEAIIELREAQEDMKNEESRRWEDWLVDESETYHAGSFSWSRDWDSGVQTGKEDDKWIDFEEVPENGLIQSLKYLISGREDDDLLYEDRVFNYASMKSAKFLAVLITVPWALDFLAHDYILMPFLDRYVKTVPLAAELLDVRRSQKLEMIEELKIEKTRMQFEMEIGKSPPLSDDELWWELRNKALELRDDWRLENRRRFANIWSDMVFGVSLFLILFFNQSKVALLKFTGYKIINNISDTGKAFLIILITDIFLGYHSESGWQTLLEVIVEHYGLEVDQSAITIFICLVPVVIDACVKLWLFKFLPRLSPRVANIFREMKRH